MKALNEEQIKRLLEEQLEHDGKPVLPGIDDDADIYRLLFTALADEPAMSVNTGLAEAVVKQVKINQQEAESLRYKAIIAAVVVAGILSAYFAISYINPTVLKSAVDFIDVYKWVFVFIILCFGLIQIADKNLVKRNLAGGSLSH